MGSVNRSRALAPTIFIAVAVALVVWFLRPLFHGPAMFLWTAPLVWVPPVVVLAIGALVAFRGRRRITVENIVSPRSSGPLIGFAVVALLLFFGLGIINGPLSARALYKDTRYEQITQLPSGANVRLLPKEVAEQTASSGFNSPTEFLSNFAIVRTSNGLQWTALRTPDGIVRTFTKKSEGIVTLDAGQTARTLRQVDAQFKVAPGLRLTDNLRWQLLKRHFFIELGEEVGIETRNGPRIVVPYVEYEGLLLRRPKLGGVFVVSPNGRIEDLEPEEARRRPEIVASGRLFPETLARRIQDAYAYKRGIWNRFFVHEEQTQITDTEANRQPYLIDFGARGARWVTVAEPYGRAFAANAVFFTDTLTGRTQVYRVPRGQSLSGNRRALDTVRSVSIPGVVFADRTAQGAGGGRFRVVEPRPVFVNNRLVYLVSVIPESANSVSKTVIVDAEQNKVLEIFDNDTDPTAEADTVQYLRTGVRPGDPTPPEDQQAETEPEEPSAGNQNGNGAGSGSGGSLDDRLEDLIRSQREILEETEALRRELEREGATP
jgi:hypothetical protein